MPAANGQNSSKQQQRAVKSPPDSRAPHGNANPVNIEVKNSDLFANNTSSQTGLLSQTNQENSATALNVQSEANEQKNGAKNGDDTIDQIEKLLSEDGDAERGNGLAQPPVESNENETANIIIKTAEIKQPPAEQQKQ